jgi:hypothetical protein
MHQISGEYVWPQWSNIDFHGPKLVKKCLSAGLNMKEVALSRKYLRMTIKEVVRR